jgi:hypothetical protein
MRLFLPNLAFVCAASLLLCGQSSNPAPTQNQPAPPTGNSNNVPSAASPADENATKAKEIIQQGIAAIGGDRYLTIRDREMQGRGYAFHHGRPSGSGSIFWSFSEFPDKERVEITKERDIAELYVGDKAYEITYKGVHPIEQKDLDDYLRRRQFSLDTVLRTWVNDSGVVLLYEGQAIAAQHPCQKVTLINSKNEAVTLYFDVDNHLPVKKTFEWRDPVDRQKNLEEEIYENYRPVMGIMAPFNVTRYFNGDMSAERFFNSVSINQGLDQAMFDPNSGYKPKDVDKH